MKSRGITTWFAMDSMVHVSPKVIALSEKLGLDVDTTVGKLARLWSWAKLAQNETGELGRLPDKELAGIMRWTKKPERLRAAMVETGLLERSADGELTIHGWYDVNGKSAEKARRDRDRKRGISRDTATDTKTETETAILKEPRGESAARPAVDNPVDHSWMRAYW